MLQGSPSPDACPPPRASLNNAKPPLVSRSGSWTRRDRMPVATPMPARGRGAAMPLRSTFVALPSRATHLGQGSALHLHFVGGLPGSGDDLADATHRLR